MVARKSGSEPARDLELCPPAFTGILAGYRLLSEPQHDPRLVSVGPG
jgi:hypothetical protein